MRRSAPSFGPPGPERPFVAVGSTGWAAWRVCGIWRGCGRIKLSPTRKDLPPPQQGLPYRSTRMLWPFRWVWWKRVLTSQTRAPTKPNPLTVPPTCTWWSLRKLPNPTKLDDDLKNLLDPNEVRARMLKSFGTENFTQPQPQPQALKTTTPVFGTSSGNLGSVLSGGGYHAGLKHHQSTVTRSTGEWVDR
ncbi:Cytadhesin P1 [Mycoplasmoides pneumoniae]|uniref:Cytadhesin P1 n=2 Tax=Mycoplasmoides pneumoniae TaxID=2104 RepID=A0AB38W7P8_MYCPM|nr:Cytadhesin P1 [Mycoplasmoides pneumoniae]